MNSTFGLEDLAIDDPGIGRNDRSVQEKKLPRTLQSNVRKLGEPFRRSKRLQEDLEQRRATSLSTVKHTHRSHKPQSIPVPSLQYLSLGEMLPQKLAVPQRLLIVLDLNGTLLSRRKGSTKISPRNKLPEFLSYCFSNHAVLVWSSARPQTVSKICSQIFTESQRSQLEGEWGRDTLELTAEQYEQHIQVYKRLSRIWAKPSLLKCPSGSTDTWTQHNTVLIDDSKEKASSEPHNHIAIPAIHGKESEKDDNALLQVIEWLEHARRWDNVSAFVNSTKQAFKYRHDWKP